MAHPATKKRGGNPDVKQKPERGQQGNFKMFHRQRGVAAYDFEFLTLIQAFDGRDL